MIRQDPEQVREGLRKLGADAPPLDELLALDEKRRSILTDVEKLKAERNRVSDEVAQLKRERKDADDLIDRMRIVSQQIKDFDNELREVDAKMQDSLLRIPNLPHQSVHVGESEADNKEIRRWGASRRNLVLSRWPIGNWV